MIYLGPEPRSHLAALDADERVTIHPSYLDAEPVSDQ